MGDQLAKGWADKKAEEPLQLKVTRRNGQYQITALGGPSLNPTEAEVQAEEDLLP